MRNLCCKPPLKPGIHSRVTESWPTLTWRNDEGGSGWSEGKRKSRKMKKKKKNKERRKKKQACAQFLWESWTPSLNRGLFEKALGAKKLRCVPLYSRVIPFAGMKSYCGLDWCRLLFNGAVKNRQNDKHEFRADVFLFFILFHFHYLFIFWQKENRKKNHLGVLSLSPFVIQLC